MERHINGTITNNYSGGIDVGSYDFSDFMYDFADDVGFAKHHNKGLGGNHEGKEVFEGRFNLETNLIGYSEFTITGYDIEKCTIGGHNLISILCDHIGEYVNIVVEAEEM